MALPILACKGHAFSLLRRGQLFIGVLRALPALLCRPVLWGLPKKRGMCLGFVPYGAAYSVAQRCTMWPVTAMGDARDACVAYGCGTKSSEGSFWRVVYKKARYDVRNRAFFVYRTAGLSVVDFAHEPGMACFRGF